MSMIRTAEQALRRGQGEGTLRRYTVATLRELCVKRGIKVIEGSRPLKMPFIEALLAHVR